MTDLQSLNISTTLINCVYDNSHWLLFETRWISCVYNNNISCYLKLNLEYICDVYFQAKSAIVVEVIKFVFFHPLF
jgi:hypothetical protein